MATTVKIEWAVTIIEGKLCIFEEDVNVTAFVHDDEEVTISNVEITGRVPRRDPHSSFLTDVVTVPMTDSSNPHMVRLGNWAMELLLADDDFIGKAIAEADEINAAETTPRQRMARELERTA